MFFFKYRYEYSYQSFIRDKFKSKNKRGDGITKSISKKFQNKLDPPPTLGYVGNGGN